MTNRTIAILREQCRVVELGELRAAPRNRWETATLFHVVAAPTGSGGGTTRIQGSEAVVRSIAVTTTTAERHD